MTPGATTIRGAGHGMPYGGISVSRENSETPKERAPSMRSPLLPLRGYRALARRLSFVAAAGLFCASIFALGVWITPALAEDRQRASASIVILRPTEEPGAVAEVIFINATGDTATTTYLTLSDAGVTVEVEVQSGHPIPDTIIVTPEEGYIAIPPELTIADGTTGRILIYTLDAVGM